MKKHVFKLAAILCMTHSFTYAQHILKDGEDVSWYMNIPQEKVFVHQNTSLLLTGEYLYYKMYCFNANTNILSDISKIGYVELISEHGTSIFKHKIKLEEGLGQGDFFVPTSVPSGNYKLLAYTQWMRNGENNHFFSSDISIVNPYRGDQSEILSQTSSSELKLNNAMAIKTSLSGSAAVKIQNDRNIIISPSSKSYGNRSKVSVVIKSLTGVRSLGNYSISVRKLDTILKPLMPTAANYGMLYKSAKSQEKSVKDEIFMPEFKGEMITGKIINKKTGNPEANKDITLSIVNNESILDITRTNQYGVFYFHINVDYNGDQAIFQVLDEHPENFNIEMNKHQSLSPKGLKFNQFKMASEMKDLILERSINNQVQNGYFSVKPDTVKTMVTDPPFYGNHQDVYLLDDYTRFPTVSETVIEVIEHAWSRKNKEGKKELIVRGREFDPNYGLDIVPVVLVDGIFIQNHENILEYETKRVKSINVLRDEYYYGNRVFKGLLSMTTIKGEFDKELSDKYLSKVTLFKPRLRKNYFNQLYNEVTNAKTSKIPDFRQQLLWMPEFVLNSNEKTIEFFTSDTNGIYEISLEGFTNNGEPVSVKERIVVE